MKSTPLVLLICLLLSASIQAQQPMGRLAIKFNKNILQPGDSLQVTVDYKDAGGRLVKKSLATLELLIENEEGRRTRLRWPVIEGRASGAIFLPNSLPPGKYTLLAGLQQRFYEVIGQVKDVKNIGSIQAMLLVKTGEWAEQRVTVDPDGSFAIRNWLFEDNALLAFHRTDNNNQPLNISIRTQLDSSYEPVAVAGMSFYIGNPPAAVRPTLNMPVETPEALFADRGTMLPAVVVKRTATTRAQQFKKNM